MHYEINVSKKNSDNRYSHYFATAPRSLENKDHSTMTTMVEHFKTLFPTPEYRISVTQYETTGTILDV